MVDIIELEEAPATIKALAIRESEGLSTIQNIVFGAFMVELKGDVGRYFPETGTIMIDMGSALHKHTLYNKGMMYIPNVWFTLIHELSHEIAHAQQIQDEPGLINYEKLPQEYEDAAVDYGQEVMMQWAEHNRIPTIEEMGWLGKQLIILINELYTKDPDTSDEVDYLRAGAAAKLEDVLALYPSEDSDLCERTAKDVDDGKIGVKVGNKRFLTAYEFFGA